MKPYYEHGGITIYHGDCREVLPLLMVPRDSLFVTDPPYGVLSEAWDEFSEPEYSRFSMSWLSLVPGCLVTFAGERTRKAFLPLLERLWPCVRQLIWSKGFGNAGEQRLWYSYESIWACTFGESIEVCEPKSLRVANLIRRAREQSGLSRGGVDMIVRGKKTGLCYRWEEAACLPTPEQIAKLSGVLTFGDEFPEAMREACESREAVLRRMADVSVERAAKRMDVFSYPPPSNGRHPCEKPVPLIVDILESIGHKSEVVVDPFCGTGTTLRAAKDLGKRSIGIELDESYCEIAANRLRQEVLF